VGLRGDAVRAGLLGVLLIVLGLGAWGTSRIFAGTQAAAYARDALAPDTVGLTAGHEYTIAYPGGVEALAEMGMTPAGLTCDWQPATGPARDLAVSTVPVRTDLTNVLGTFVAPAGGQIRITCARLGPMFVDDADDARADVAGWLLLLATAALTAGGVLCLRAYAARGERSPAGSARAGSTRAGDTAAGGGSAGAAREDEQVERLVRIVHLRALDDEVVDTDGRDIGP
jgi:hypothetical protein